MKNKITLVLIFIICLNYFAIGQNKQFSKSSIKIGLGIGASLGNKTTGLGVAYNIGYQREIWKDRLRVNPNFSIGHYSSRLLLDARDQYFNSINLETNLYYDLIIIKWVSLVIGVGGVVNNCRGMRGSGGDPESYTEPPTSEYVNDFHFGAFFGGGIRISFPNKRTVINIMPFNFHAGNNDFAEFHPKIELDFKF